MNDVDFIRDIIKGINSSNMNDPGVLIRKRCLRRYTQIPLLQNSCPPDNRVYKARQAALMG